MFKDDMRGLLLSILPFFIVCLLLYLSIIHSNLFSWINLELLKLFIPDIFMPIKRANGLLYNEAILAGAVSFAYIVFFPFYFYFILKLKIRNSSVKSKEVMIKSVSTLIYKEDGKYNIKFFFAFIFLFIIIIVYPFKLHWAKQSNIPIRQYITSDSQRYLLMDYFSYNTLYTMFCLLLFGLILALFFNAKKEK